jgi:hypothetical protein
MARPFFLYFILSSTYEVKQKCDYIGLNLLLFPLSFAISYSPRISGCKTALFNLITQPWSHLGVEAPSIMPKAISFVLRFADILTT